MSLLDSLGITKSFRVVSYCAGLNSPLSWNIRPALAVRDFDFGAFRFDDFSRRGRRHCSPPLDVNDANSKLLCTTSCKCPAASVANVSQIGTSRADNAQITLFLSKTNALTFSWRDKTQVQAATLTLDTNAFDLKPKPK
jgi:hypothetical protein